MSVKTMSTKLIPVCLCPKCDTPIKITLKQAGQIIRSERKTEPTKEHMKKISKKGLTARWGNKI